MDIPNQKLKTMIVDRISYQKIFPTGMAYLNHKIGVEVAIDETESPDEAFKLAKKLVEEWNVESNPSYAAAMEYMKPSEGANEFSWDKKTGTITPSIEPPPSKEQAFKDLINSKYQTKKTLENLRPQVEAMNNQDITETYLLKLKSFE